VRLGAVLFLLVALGVPAIAQDTGPEKTKKPAGFLGVSMEGWPVPDSEPPLEAIRVTAVVPASAAANAGLEIGDVILSVDGKSLAAPKAKALEAFGKRIRGLGVGAEVKLSIRRRSVTVRTYVDETPTGPGVDAFGPSATRAILPDLGALLEEHEEQLVGVRARSFVRERVVTVVLGRRPGTTDTPLPENGTLRPRLDALPLDSAGALAERVISRASLGERSAASTYHELLERFEQDERIQDPFRLNTVRYLHRAPLRLPLATKSLALGLRRTFTAPRAATANEPPTGLEALVATARLHLDSIAVVDSETAPTAPAPGSPAGAHGLYVYQCVQLAERRVERAMSGLTDEERTFLEETLPGLADVFAEQIYLHTDQDQERWKRHARAIRLLPKIDRGALAQSVQALIPLSDPTYLVQLRLDLRAEESAGKPLPTAGGVRGSLLWWGEGGVAIGGSGDNEYRREGVKVVIDLDGDDRYHQPVGSGRPGSPVGVCIDLGGDDRYQSTVSFAQGAGFMGVGFLLDVSGNDHYTSSQSFAQGASLAGVGLCVDLDGDDVYRGTSYAQGSALTQGIAALVDMDGDDLVSAGLYAQGFAGPGSFGCLLARGGDDRYSAVGMAPCSYGDPGTYRAMSQGSAVGFRHQASGGIAILLDDGGSDVYEAGNFSQGGGYFFGWGSLVDLGAQADRYEGSRYSLGFSAHSALGSLWEDGGDDIYRGWVGAQLSAAWDLSVTSFLDEAGDDRYEPGPGFSVGASAHNGFSLFVDGGGEDSYRVGPGKAGPNTYHSGESLSIFVDAGGHTDRYVGGGLANGKASVQPLVGIALDVGVPVEELTGEDLEEALNPTSDSR
jgi:hypothetical protein